MIAGEKIFEKDIKKVEEVISLTEISEKYSELDLNLYSLKVIIEGENMIVINPNRILTFNIESNSLLKKSKILEKYYSIKAHKTPIWTKQGKPGVIFTGIQRNNTSLIDENLRIIFNFPLEITNFLLTKVGKFRYLFYTKDSYDFQKLDSYTAFNIDTKKKLLNMKKMNRENNQYEKIEKFLKRLLELQEKKMVTENLLYKSNIECLIFVAKEGSLSDRSLKSVRSISKFDREIFQKVLKKANKKKFDLLIYENFDISNVHFVETCGNFYLYVLIYDEDSCTEASRNDYSLLINFTLAILKLEILETGEVSIVLESPLVKMDQIFRHVGIKSNVSNLENFSTFPLVNGFSLKPTIGGYKNGYFSFDCDLKKFFRIKLEEFMKEKNYENYDVIGFGKSDGEFSLVFNCMGEVLKLVYNV